MRIENLRGSWPGNMAISTIGNINFGLNLNCSFASVLFFCLIVPLMVFSINPMLTMSVDGVKWWKRE